jgi:predicted RNA binding protein YcfA (HicA-like mRNA interferase family)
VARRYDSRQVERALANTGFVFVRWGSKASHGIYRGPNGYSPISIPLGHPKGVAEPLLKTQVQLGGVAWTDFKKNL